MKNKSLLLLNHKILNRLTKSKYFTKSYIVVDFNKIKIIENENWKNVSGIIYKFFEVLFMNFGVCRTPSIFEKYINDISIYNKTKKNTRNTSDWCFRNFKNWVTIGYRQMRTLRPKIIDLNLIVISENIKINPKNASVFVWPKFEVFKNVQKILNFVNFYKCFMNF